MKLKPAEEWTKELDEHLEMDAQELQFETQRVRQIQADALRWVGQRLLEEDTKLDAYYDITRLANQLDPKT